MTLVKRSPKMTANLRLGHAPLTGRHLPLPLGPVHDEEEQIIAVLKKDQTGIAVVDLCRKHGISDATLCNWRNCYGGMKVSDTRRRRALDDENRMPEKLLAEIKLVFWDLAWLAEVANVRFRARPQCQLLARSSPGAGYLFAGSGTTAERRARPIPCGWRSI